MNLNRQIKPFSADGIPAYNAKINELIAAINWLMKMRTVNGKPIRDSDQGPVIDLSPVNQTQGGTGLGLTDPDGNPAGWLKALVFDPNYVTNSEFDESWIWSGTVESNPLIPWMKDPNGVQAQWWTDNNAQYYWGTRQGLSLNSIAPTSVPLGTVVINIDCLGLDFSTDCILHFGSTQYTPAVYTPNHLTAFNVNVPNVQGSTNVWLTNAAGQTSNTLIFTVT